MTEAARPAPYPADTRAMLENHERKIVDTVWSFMDRTAQAYARMQAERWNQEMHANCLECGMQSPIEDLFWIATKTLCEAFYEPFNPDIDENGRFPHGVYVRPQANVDPYRVDFLVTREPFLEVQRCQPIVVELDGHDFHDKDKKQRAYEKARDRHLVKRGFRVLHYTGSEIVADPFKVAHEVLALLNAVNSPEYDPADPFQLGD